MRDISCVCMAMKIVLKLLNKSLEIGLKMELSIFNSVGVSFLDFCLIGCHDFKNFSKQHSKSHSSNPYKTWHRI